MTRLDPQAFAALLCDWCLEPTEGQQVMVSTSTLALSAMEGGAALFASAISAERSIRY